MSVFRQSPATQTAAVQVVALVVGVVFLLLGVLGFIPGVVTNFDEFGATGPDSGALLFGLFLVSIQKNIAHLLFGIVGVLCARGARSARNYLIWGGLFYLALWVFGLLVTRLGGPAVYPLSAGDNWLHAGLGGAMVVLGFVLGLRAQPKMDAESGEPEFRTYRSPSELFEQGYRPPDEPDRRPETRDIDEADRKGP